MVSKKKRELFASLHKEAQQQQPLLRKVNQIRAEYVPSIELLKLRNKKKKISSPQQVYETLLEMSIVPERNVTIIDLYPEEPLPQLKEGAYVTGLYPIIVTGVIDEQEISEVYQIPLEIKVISDVVQDKKRDEYFEGILQLRNVPKQVLQFAERQLDIEKSGVSNTISLSEHNHDLYVINKKPLRKIMQLLQNKFGGEVLFTKKIFTMDKDTQKDITRDTALFRKYNVDAGDVAVKEGRVLLITSVAKTIQAKDLTTQNNIILENDSKLEKLPWKKMHVVSHSPLQVLDPTTHESMAATHVIDSITENQHDVMVAKFSQNTVVAKQIKKT